MFNKKPDPNEALLDDAIHDILAYMKGSPADAEEYIKSIKQLEKLYKIKRGNATDRVSNDTIAMIAGNLFGIMLIVGHERANVITSKALSFVQKLR